MDHQHIVNLLTSFEIEGILRTIVSTNKSVTIRVLLHAVDVLDRLFKGNVHVAVEAGKDTAVVDTGIETDVDVLSNHAFEEVIRAACFWLLLRLC